MRVKNSIIVAEDSTILREGLRSLLSSYEDLHIVDEAENGREAIQSVEKWRPDLVIMDLIMPKTNGLEAIREIKHRFPGTKVLALTIHKSEEYVFEAFRAGADGYTLKDSTSAQLVLAIRKVLRGKHYISPGISQKVIQGYLDREKILEHKAFWDPLTRREWQILKLIGEGYKSKEIAQYLSISVNTVDKHRSNLMEKLGLHKVSNLVTYAIEKGLVTKE